ncbi:hypothetical protein ACVWYT_000720 [Streptomyces sp. TE4109]
MPVRHPRPVAADRVDVPHPGLRGELGGRCDGARVEVVDPEVGLRGALGRLLPLAVQGGVRLVVLLGDLAEHGQGEIRRTAEQGDLRPDDPALGRGQRAERDLVTVGALPDPYLAVVVSGGAQDTAPRGLRGDVARQPLVLHTGLQAVRIPYEVRTEPVRQMLVRPPAHRLVVQRPDPHDEIGVGDHTGRLADGAVERRRQRTPQQRLHIHTRGGRQADDFKCGMRGKPDGLYLDRHTLADELQDLAVVRPVTRHDPHLRGNHVLAVGDHTDQRHRGALGQVVGAVTQVHQAVHVPGAADAHRQEARPDPQRRGRLGPGRSRGMRGTGGHGHGRGRTQAAGNQKATPVHMSS